MSPSRSVRGRLRSRVASCAVVDPPESAPLDWSRVALIVAGAGGYAFVLNAFVFDGRSYAWLTTATGAIVRPTLVVNVVGVLALFGVLRWRLDRGPGTVGIRWGDPGTAVAVLAGCWLAIQAVGIAARWRQGMPLVVPADGAAIRVAVGTGLSQVAGVALFEEVVYRGLLFGHLLVRFEDRFDRSWVSFGLAIVVSAGVFAAVHVPRRLRLGTVTGSLGGDLIALFVVGVTVAVVYLRTGSLLLTIGMHALYNRPLSPVLSPEAARAVFAVLLVVLVLGWPLVDRIASAPVPRSAWTG